MLTICWFATQTAARTGAGFGGCGTAKGRANVNDTVVPWTSRLGYGRPAIAAWKAWHIALSFNVISTSTDSWPGSESTPHLKPVSHQCLSAARG